MPEILYAPNQEKIVTSNAWAFLHWLRTTRGIDLPDWGALQRWWANDQAAFGLAIAEFARLSKEAQPLSRHDGQEEALVLLRHDGARIALTGNDLGSSGVSQMLPADIASPLTRLWPRATLIRPAAELLLHADLRPDDRLLLGRESAGVPEAVHDAADSRIRIPMRPGLRSLNVAQAAAIALAEALRQTGGLPA